MLNRLTDITGGVAFRVFTGRRFALRSLADLLLEELHQQYTLGYYPTNPAAGADWREIEVQLRTSELPVRHRPGYYGPDEVEE
jgi:VWFA-related protein